MYNIINCFLFRSCLQQDSRDEMKFEEIMSSLQLTKSNSTRCSLIDLIYTTKYIYNVV